MSSGFITLRNGLNWSQRWSRYDYVLQIIMDELSVDGNEGKFKIWLKSLLPSKEDIECGWSFIRVSDDGEMIVRILDTRLMREEYAQIFWVAVKKVRDKTLEQDEFSLINQLYTCYESSLKDDYVNPKSFDPIIDEISDSQIGPGWDLE